MLDVEASGARIAVQVKHDNNLNIAHRHPEQDGEAHALRQLNHGTISMRVKADRVNIDINVRCEDLCTFRLRTLAPMLTSYLVDRVDPFDLLARAIAPLHIDHWVTKSGI